MESKNLGHISEKELDQLLNESFLDIDFENSAGNDKFLDLVANNSLAKNIFFQPFAGYRVDLFIFSLSAFIFLNSLYRFIDHPLYRDIDEVAPTTRTESVKVENPNAVQLGKKHTAILILPGDNHNSKNKKTARQQKILQQKIPAITVKIEKCDTVFESKSSKSENKAENVLLAISNKDSSCIIQKNAPAPLPIPVYRKVRPARDTLSIAAKKARKEIKRKRYLFHRDGILIMKGSTYRKSRLH